ncbi:hypothetical protein CRG98_008550 [Punica granatum]|uniref:Uncharacterized protein n=1 Tax=Punica granatum TaxID=22663 RepID=A0A2I0KT87_PUNGR|nr:hypothetical protein CRG98_008550 [Punica granatum]
MPSTLLELSTMEMAEDQGLEAYAVKWRARAAKHVPPISEAQQIQLFHSTLKGAYYLHLLAHTSLFSNLIDAGKKLDIGVKLGTIEGPAEKKEGESSKKPFLFHRRTRPLLYRRRYPYRFRHLFTQLLRRWSSQHRALTLLLTHPSLSHSKLHNPTPAFLTQLYLL